MTREEFQTQYGIIGESPAIREIAGTVMQVAPTSLSILITGESGTGKEVIANAIHGYSGRAKNNFIAVNCGAIPETLLESELFGHEKGAYTGAHEARKGYFEHADNGTIFLDEIGETQSETQVKLLRVLETGEYSRVGSADIRRVNVRVIAATNKDLDLELRRGTFREDLYYRLRAVSIHLPPLRERKEDIPLLFDFFAEKVAEKHNATFKGISPGAMHRMQALPWLGNVRELRNLIETMLVLEQGNLITESVVEKYVPTRPSSAMLPMQIPFKTPEQSEREIIIRALFELKNEITALRESVLEDKNPLMTPVGRVQHDFHAPQNVTLKDAEKLVIEATLKRNMYSRHKTAQELGISEKTLHRKINAYKLLEKTDIADAEPRAEEANNPKNH